MIHRNAYDRRINWERTMLDAGPWIAVVAIIWTAAIVIAWRAWKGPWSG